MLFGDYVFFSSFSFFGYNNALVFKTIEDEDVDYVEKRVRAELLPLTKHIFDFNNFVNVVEEKQHVHFFGTQNANDFKFSLDERWLLKQIVSHVKTIVDTPEINSGLVHFCKNEGTAVETIPFFCGTKNSSTAIESQQTKKPLLLEELIANFEKNSLREKEGYRYSSNIKDIATYLRLVSGPIGHATHQANLPGAFPSISSVNRYIRKRDGIIEEAVLRSNELLKYLEENKVPLVVSLSEDATRNEGRIQYRSATNEIIGFVPPIDQKTGMPIPHTYPARNAREIINYFNPLKPISNNITVIMA